MANLYALLIGVDHYFGYTLPSNLAYRSLGGCVRDIDKVYNFLTTRIQMDPANITKLTASLGQNQPLEPQSEWPTYTNMVNAFQQLTAKVNAGDQVYIQYSGHGGRTTTMFPALKGEGAFDEGLVPPDIGKPGDPNARYLRDVEMHDLIQSLVDKKVLLTVVFDCCHSGGATRDIGGARKRGISNPDLSPPPTDSAVGTLPDLIARWQSDGAATSRSLSNDSSWLFEPKGYTLFAACRANESAFEFPFDGRESNGALTYWMLDTLAQSGPNTTWQTVADRVGAKVHGQFEQQMPMLQGEGDIQVFGSDKLESRFGVSVLSVQGGGRVRIAAGEAHGVAEGTQFAVYPTMADADDPNKRQGLIELTEIGATDSWATVVEPADGTTTTGTIEVGSQAIMLTTTAVRIQRDVRVVIEDATLRSRVERAVEREGQGFIAIAQEGSSADFLVDLHEERPEEFVLLDSAGGEIPQLRPALKVADESAISRLIQRLVHLTQYRNVLMLDMPDQAMTAKLKVEIEGKKVSQPGDKISLKIINTQDPHQWDANDPSRILNITVLVISSDWSVTQIYPRGAANFEPVDPGKDIPLTFTAFLPEGQNESVDVLKVFATRSPTNFRWLELPALDNPIQRTISRSVDSDPLEQMLAAMGQEDTQTRAVRLTSSPDQDRGWTVAQVEMRVSATGEDGLDASGPDGGDSNNGASNSGGSDSGDASPNAATGVQSGAPSTAATSPKEGNMTAQSSAQTGARAQIDPQDLNLPNTDEFQILVEFSEPATPLESTQAGARSGTGRDTTSQIQERSQHAIRAAMNTIREMALQTDLMRQGIPGGSQPRMVKVKFGINLDLQVGAFLAKSGVGATMEVELEWARRSDDVLRVLLAETDVDGALFTDANGQG